MDPGRGGSILVYNLNFALYYTSIDTCEADAYDFI